MRFGLTLNAVAGCLFVGLIGFKADEGGGHWQAPQLAVDKYGEIYAPDWGIVPDGQDHSAQLASLISAMGQSQQGVKGAGASMAVIRFAPGRTVASGDWSLLPCVRIAGAGRHGGAACTTLTSSDPVATVGRNRTGVPGTVPLDISDMRIDNSVGDSINITGVISGSIRRVHCEAKGNGIKFPYVVPASGTPINNLQIHLTDCETLNCGQAGISGWMNAQIDNHASTGCGIGLDLSGTIVLNLPRLEENGVSLVLGSVAPCQGVINVMTSEGSLLHARLTKNARRVIINVWQCLGDKHLGAVNPTVGLEMDGGSQCEIHAADVSGQFTQSAIFLGPWVGPTIFGTTTAGNGSGPAWVNQMPAVNLTTIQTAIPGTVASPTPTPVPVPPVKTKK